MSEGAGQESVVPEGQGSQEVTQPESTAINPAWEPVLKDIPQQYHSQLAPHFSEWDKNYQQSIQKVHSQYEPWKPFIDEGYSPEDVNYGLQLMQNLSENPAEFVKALNEWYEAENGSGEQQGLESTQQNPSPEFDITQHPKWQEMESATRAMAEIMLERHEQEQAQLADSELDQEIASLKEKFKDRGEFDEDYVLGVAMNDPEANLERAVEQYFAHEERILQKSRQPGPPILGAGGAIPTGGVDPRQLSEKDRRAYVANVLRQAHGGQT